MNAIFALRLWSSTSNSVLSTSWFSAVSIFFGQDSISHLSTSRFHYLVTVSSISPGCGFCVRGGKKVSVHLKRTRQYHDDEDTVLCVRHVWWWRLYFYQMVPSSLHMTVDQELKKWESPYLYQVSMAPVISRPPGTWRDMRPMEIIFSPVSGWKAESYICFAAHCSFSDRPGGVLPSLQPHENGMKVTPSMRNVNRLARTATLAAPSITLTHTVLYSHLFCQDNGLGPVQLHVRREHQARVGNS